MEENQVNAVVTEQSTVSQDTDQNIQPAQPADNGSQGQTVQQQDRTFTRDEVTQILKRRLDRYQNNVYKKYGVENSEALDSLFEKAKSYDDIVKERDEALETVACMRNNINQDKIDDLYFGISNFPVLLIEGENVTAGASNYIDSKMT